MPSYIKHIMSSWRAMLLVGFLASVISGALSFTQPLEYRAQSQVFILSRTTAGVDPFTVIKTAERIGENLTHIIYTSSFFDHVISVSQGQLSAQEFGDSERDQRKNWEKTVDVGVVPGTGFLRIAAFDSDPDHAAVITQAVVTTLIDRGWEYVGGEVQIKAVDNVVLSRFPVRPNIPANMLLGFIVGVLGVAIVELFRAPKHRHSKEMGPVDWLRHL